MKKKDIATEMGHLRADVEQIKRSVIYLEELLSDVYSCWTPNEPLRLNKDVNEMKNE